MLGIRSFPRNLWHCLSPTRIDDVVDLRGLFLSRGHTLGRSKTTRPLVWGPGWAKPLGVNDVRAALLFRGSVLRP